MNSVRSFFILFFVSAPILTFGQNTVNFTQFFVNPYSVNPSFAGIDGQKAFFLAYRKQWADFENAPTTTNFSYHSPLKAGFNIGFNVNNYSRSVLTSTGFQMTFAYALPLGEHKYLRFGISGGAVSNGIKLDDLGSFGTDPALLNAVDNSFSPLGNAGISIHLKSTHFGVAMPTLLAPTYITTKSFAIEEVDPFQSIIVHANHRFYFAKNKNIFEPYVVYRINTGLPSQLEAAGVLHLNHVIWLGGSYKQDFGISALGGVKLNNVLAIGASYSLKNTGINELNSPSYEIQLSFLAGKKDKKIEGYSFVSTTKPKKKNIDLSSQLAAKKKQEEAAKKKQQEELAAKKKQEEAAVAKRQQEEATAKRQQEEAAKRQQDEALAKRQQEETATAKRQQDEALAKRQQEEAAAKRQAEAVLLAKRQQEEAAQKPPVEQPKPKVEEPKVTEPVVVVPPPVEKPPVVQHSGGPRLKHQSSIATLETDEHGESERLARLEVHAEDHSQPHGEGQDAHPHAERHEFVQQGDHQSELDLGDYVVAGVFKSEENAKQFSDGLVKLKFKADYGHLSQKNLWYVYLLKTKNIDKAREERNKLRTTKMFRDAWLLTVQE